jgi:hypothetical protein
MGAIARLCLHVPTPQNGRVIHHPKLLSWVDSFRQIDAAAGG